MFSDLLEITLDLTINGAAFSIPGANIKAVELDRTSLGFTGWVEFVVIDDRAHGGKEQDTLIDEFLKPDLIDVALTITPRYEAPEQKVVVTPVSVKGLSTHKRLEENADPTHKDRAILWRLYTITFADPARVLWSQHYPCELYTKKAMKDVIDAHKGAKIIMAYDWPVLTTEAPMLFLNLARDLEASFYDFLLWYADNRCGVLSYDDTNGYKLAATKSTEGEPSNLFGDDVARLVVDFPEVARHKRNVLNSFAGAAAIKEVANAQAVDGVRQDYLLRTPIAQRLDDRQTLETSRLVVRAPELEVVFARWPTVKTFSPGDRLKFVKGNLWSADALQVTKTWRVYEHRIRARARDSKPDADHNLPEAPYEVEVEARLEQEDDKTPRLPEYLDPTYPGYIEGKVVSEQGEDADITYQFYTDADSSLDNYQVKIPLWQDQIITVPYDPHYGSGKMYVPLYKGARVLLALELEHAAVARLLDWREGVRMAMDAQGEQLFFGKKNTAGTMVNHAYEDSKPVFKIARTNEKDKATIQIKEGVLTIEVREDA